MSKIKISIVSLFSIALPFTTLSADTEKTVIGAVEMPDVQNSDAFIQIKKKLGKWEGKMTQNLTGEVIDVSYEWKLTSGGNTITETIVEDGVEMLTTYSDDDGQLVVKHYCALGTQPVFKVSQASDSVVQLTLDKSRVNLHSEHHSFVTGMKWTTNPSNPATMTFENTVLINGELTDNIAQIKRVN